MAAVGMSREVFKERTMVSDSICKRGPTGIGWSSVFVYFEIDRKLAEGTDEDVETNYHEGDELKLSQHRGLEKLTAS